MLKNRNILVIAYACEPDTGSEPGVGWNFSTELSRYANVWLVTRANNREPIEEVLARNQGLNINWVYVDLSKPFRWLKKHIPLGIQLYYMIWQWKAFLRCRRLARETDFSILHHLTFGITWLAPVSSMLNIPFVWGPIGGGDIVPPAYLLKERSASIMQEALYFFLSRIFCRISVFNYIARRRARAILFRSRSVEHSFPDTTVARRYIVSETASRKIRSAPTVKPDNLKAMCIGRHQYWKAYRHAIKGFCKYLAEGGTGTLVILGHGPETDLLKTTHKMHGSPEQVQFLGNVPHNVVIENLESSSVLIHPSFRDGGSWAVLEALSYSIPVICQNISGTADIVTSECGILIDTDEPELSDSIAGALHKLSGDRVLLDKLSIGALERIKNSYTWDKRANDIIEIYNKILQHK